MELKEKLSKDLAELQAAEVDLTPIIESRLYLEKCIQEVEYLLQSSTISPNPSAQQYVGRSREGSFVNPIGSSTDAHMQMGQYSQESSIDMQPEWEDSVQPHTSQEAWRILGPFPGHLDTARKVIFSSPHEVITASDDGTIKRWNLNLCSDSANKSIVSLTHRGHQGSVLALVFDPVTGNLYSAGQDKSILVWGDDVPPRSGQLRGHKSVVWDLDLNVESRQLASASQDGTVKIWTISRDADDKCLIGTIRYQGEHHESKGPPTAHAVAFIEGGNKVVVGYGNGALHVVEVRSRKRVLELANDASNDDLSNNDSDQLGIAVTGIAPLERKNIVITSHSNGLVRVFKLGTGELVKEWVAHTSGPACLTLSPDFRELLTGGMDGHVRFWNVEDDYNITHESRSSEVVLSVAWYDPAVAGDEDTDESKQLTASVGGDTHLHVYQKND